MSLKYGVHHGAGIGAAELRRGVAFLRFSVALCPYHRIFESFAMGFAGESIGFEILAAVVMEKPLAIVGFPYKNPLYCRYIADSNVGF